MGNKIEGYWDCQYCYSKGIQGRYTRCPYCGKSRGVGTEFYLKEKENISSEEKVGEEPDWYCSYCDTLNPASRKDCINCGSLRKESTDDYFSLKNRSNNSNDGNAEKKEKKSILEFISNNKILFLFIYGFIALTILLILVTRMGNVTFNITEKHWLREIMIEEYKMTRESDWSLPDDGQLAYTQQEVYTYNQILDHYETVTEKKSEKYISGYETVEKYVDMGNGYFKNQSYQKPIYSTRYYNETYQKPIYRSEPVYKTKYYYDAKRWVYTRTISAEGSEEPYWPDISNLKENEREGGKQETYTITGVNKKNQNDTYKLSYDLWNKVSVGDKVKLSISGEYVKEIKSVKSRQKK